MRQTKNEIAEREAIGCYLPTRGKSSLDVKVRECSNQLTHAQKNAPLVKKETGPTPKMPLIQYRKQVHYKNIPQAKSPSPAICLSNVLKQNNK